MTRRKNLVALFAMFALLAGLSAWLQFGLLARPANEVTDTESNHPDYFIKNFASTGIDQRGKKYRMSADSLTHYPLDRRALLTNPYIIQYRTKGAPTHIRADSGWLYDDDARAVLSGDVRVTQDSSGDFGGGAASVNTMTIRLGDDNG